MANTNGIFIAAFFPYSRLKEFNRYKVSAVINMKDFISCSEGMNSPLLLIQKRYLHRNIASERNFFYLFSMFIFTVSLNTIQFFFLWDHNIEGESTSKYIRNTAKKKWFYSFELVRCL